MDGDETKKLLAENSRKMTVLRVNERLLTRQYTTIREMERYLRKENEKQKAELTLMETAVTEKFGHFQRFKAWLVIYVSFFCLVVIFVVLSTAF